MLRRIGFPTLVLAAACSGSELPTAPSRTTDAAAFSAKATDHAISREALALRIAKALAQPGFRSYLFGAIGASAHPEGKILLSRFLAASNGRGFRELAAAGGQLFVPAAEQLAAETIELYVPVPSHRASWRGGPDILVGTIGGDGEMPLAFDVRGRRLALDRTTPPSTPVIAVVPLETDPKRLVERGLSDAAACQENCDGGGGDGGGGGGGGGGGTGTLPGLYLTSSHLNESYESWLKGKPEIELLVLGQKGGTDSLTSYQCAGNGAVGASFFDQNELDWAGSALVFSQSQLDAFKAQHPGQATRLFFMEDDDGPCQLKANNTDLRRLIAAVDSVVRGSAGGKDTTGGTIGRIYRNYTVAQKIFAVLASLIKSNDDLIGNAVEDVVTTERYPGYNWIIKGDNGQTNGYVKLEMR